jgi:predicted permease
VVAQIALSLVLVVSAGLFVGTFRNLARLDPGFTADGVLLADVDLRRTGVATDGLLAMHGRILERVRGIPGVSRASSADLTPVGSSTWNDEVVVDGFTPKSMMDAVTWFNEVAEGYFETLDTRLLAGRDFDRGDTRGGARVAIVNDAWGRKFFGNASPLGREFRVRHGDSQTAPYTIVGVVENSSYRSLRAGSEPTAYLVHAQADTPGPMRTLALRSSGDPIALIEAVKRGVAEVHPAITLDFRTLSDQLANSLQRERMLAVLSGLFGALALALAVLGLYGVTSYAVARRRGELGVRIALGAVRGRVIRMVLREVVFVALVGMVVGAAGALGTSKLVTTFLFDVRPNEPAVYVLAILVLGLVALGAGLLPAWRAARVDPIEALREQ